MKKLGQEKGNTTVGQKSQGERDTAEVTASLPWGRGVGADAEWG